MNLHDEYLDKNRIAELEEELRRVIDHIPRDVKGSTYWDEDDGTYVEHKWVSHAKTVLAGKEQAVSRQEVVDGPSLLKDGQVGSYEVQVRGAMQRAWASAGKPHSTLESAQDAIDGYKRDPYDPDDQYRTVLRDAPGRATVVDHSEEMSR